MGSGLQDHFSDDEDGNLLTFQAFSMDSNVTANSSDDGANNWKVDFGTTPDYFGTTAFVIRATDSRGAIFEKIVPWT